MTRHVLFAPALARSRDARAKLRHKLLHPVAVGLKRGAVLVDVGLENLHQATLPEPPPQRRADTARRSFPAHPEGATRCRRLRGSGGEQNSSPADSAAESAPLLRG